VKDVRFIVKYSSEQRLISFSENVSDQHAIAMIVLLRILSVI